MQLVFVYLGRKVPKYLLANMNQVQARFPDRDLTFIGDSSDVCLRVINLGFKAWQSPSPETNWEITRNSLSHDPNFRDGFWFKTLARFFSLNEYMKTIPSESALLIESDVWISPEYPLQSFDTAEFDCAYPLSSLDQGVASTFYIKDSQCMKRFLEFAEEKATSNPEMTDVSILGSFYTSGRLRTTILPSAINVNDGFNDHVGHSERITLANSEYFKEGIFDASTWGQYLTGLDPRNHWGYRPVFSIQPKHSVNPGKYSFLSFHGGLHVSISGESSSLYSLHIHSKDIRVFSKLGFIEERISQSNLGTRNEMVIRFVIRFLPSRIKMLLKIFLKKVKDSNK